MKVIEVWPRNDFRRQGAVEARIHRACHDKYRICAQRLLMPLPGD